MRVHELAKEYSIKSTEFVDIIQEFGFDIKSQLSSLDDAQVSDIRYKMSIRDSSDDPEIKEWVSSPYPPEPVEEETTIEEIVVDEEDIEVFTTPSEVDDELNERLEEVVEEVVESLSQEVVVEQPKGFFGWLRSLFS